MREILRDALACLSDVMFCRKLTQVRSIRPHRFPFLNGRLNSNRRYFNIFTPHSCLACEVDSGLSLIEMFYSSGILQYSVINEVAPQNFSEYGCTLLFVRAESHRNFIPPDTNMSHEKCMPIRCLLRSLDFYAHGFSGRSDRIRDRRPASSF